VQKEKAGLLFDAYWPKDVADFAVPTLLPTVRFGWAEIYDMVGLVGGVSAAMPR